MQTFHSTFSLRFEFRWFYSLIYAIRQRHLANLDIVAASADVAADRDGKYHQNAAQYWYDKQNDQHRTCKTRRNTNVDGNDSIHNNYSVLSRWHKKTKPLAKATQCTLNASRAAPWWVTVGMQTNRQTDGRTPDRYITLDAASVTSLERAARRSVSLLTCCKRRWPLWGTCEGRTEQSWEHLQPKAE